MGCASAGRSLPHQRSPASRSLQSAASAPAHAFPSRQRERNGQSFRCFSPTEPCPCYGSRTIATALHEATTPGAHPPARTKTPRIFRGNPSVVSAEGGQQRCGLPVCQSLPAPAGHSPTARCAPRPPHRPHRGPPPAGAPAEPQPPGGEPAVQGDPPRASLLLTDLPIIIIIIFLLLLLLPLQIQQHILVLHIHLAKVAAPRARSPAAGEPARPEPCQPRGRSGGGGRPPTPSRQEGPPPPCPEPAPTAAPRPAGEPGPFKALGLLEMCQNMRPSVEGLTTAKYC